jgi:hypothetical protein
MASPRRQNVLEAAVYNILSTTAAITAITSTRIYPLVAPQSADFPRITYQIIVDAPDHVLSGASGLRESRVQIDCWTDDADYDMAHTLADKVRVALDTFRGTAGGTGSIWVHQIHLNDQSDGFEEDIEASERGIRRVIMDFTVWYKQE